MILQILKVKHWHCKTKYSCFRARKNTQLDRYIDKVEFKSIFPVL